MIQVSVRGGMNEALAQMQSLADGLKDKAIVRSLNRALDGAYTTADKGIRARYNIKKKDLAPAFQKARAYLAQAVPFAQLTVSGKRISLYAFDARGVTRKRGALKAGDLTVQVLNARGRSVVQGRRALVGRPFIQTIKGRTGIWQRATRDRFPIKLLHSVSMPQAFLNKVVFDAVKQATREVFVKNFKQQVQFLTERRGG